MAGDNSIHVVRLKCKYYGMQISDINDLEFIKWYLQHFTLALRPKAAKTLIKSIPKEYE